MLNNDIISDIMRRGISILLIAIGVLGCGQDAEIRKMGNPDERLNETLDSYRGMLTASVYGWKSFLYPGEGGGYNFFMQFSTEGRVSMMGDIIEETATVPFESSYRLDAFQRPSLVFDTYSYIHYLSDPDPNVNGGILGHGYLSDFEFSFESASGDTLRLKGNQHGSELLLIRATAKEHQLYTNGRLNTVMQETMNFQKTNPYLFLIAEDNRKTGVILNAFSREVTMVEENEGEIGVTSSRFSFTTEGILLHDALSFRDLTFREIYVDAANDKMYLLGEHGDRIDVKVMNSPVFPMHQLVGIDFLTITLEPDPVNSPGWSSYFRSTWIHIDDALDGCCGLRLSDIQFLFNYKTRQMDINIYVRDNANGFSYRLRYPYTYTKTWNGVFTITPSVKESPNYNAQYFRPVMTEFLDQFEGKKFIMDYLQTEKGYVGQVKSQDYSNFYFAGELR